MKSDAESKAAILFELTRREREIVRLLAQGWTNRQIAQELCLTVRTVKFHTGNLYCKIRVRSRSEAIVWTWKNLRP